MQTKSTRLLFFIFFLINASSKLFYSTELDSPTAMFTHSYTSEGLISPHFVRQSNKRIFFCKKCHLSSSRILSLTLCIGRIMFVLLATSHLPMLHGMFRQQKFCTNVDKIDHCSCFSLFYCCCCRSCCFSPLTSDIFFAFREKKFITCCTICKQKDA